MSNKIRLDQYLVEKGYTPSRTKAQDLIRAGLVSLKTGGSTRTVVSTSEWIDETHQPEIIIQKNALDKYVSRAGLKMEGALDHLKLAVERWHALDVGISTGGFTDCLLQRGVQHVVGVDVGHNQLSQRLKVDPRIVSIEGINAREIHKAPQVIDKTPAGGFDIAVVDVSFISLTLVLPSVVSLIKPWGYLLALVKPQFELNAAALDKKGIVKDEGDYSIVEKKLKEHITTLELNFMDYFPSSLEGKDGNKEFFIFCQKK